MQEKLLRASFKGAEFFVSNSTITFGQKTVVHEFPNSNRTEVEFLGLKGDEFLIDAVIQGIGESYFTRRNALINALKSTGSGILVHPTAGSIKVSAVSNSISEDFSKKIGVARFSITFRKTDKNLFPKESINNTSKISNFTNNVLNTVESDIANGWDISADPYNFDIAFNTLTNVSDIFSIATKSIKAVENFISDMNESIESFIKNITKNTYSGTSLARSFTDMFENLDFYAQTAKDQFKLLQQYFSFGNDATSITKVNTYASVQAENNNDLINNGVLFNSLALAYKNSTEIDYTNTEEVDNIESQLENQYDSIISNNISDDLRFEINNLRNESRKFFDTVRDNVADIVSVKISSEQGISPLTYRYYGNLSLANNILTLNDIGDATFISGNLRVLTSV